MRDVVGKASIYTTLCRIIAIPAGDKGILANIVWKKAPFVAIEKMSDFNGIHNVERGIIEVGFDDDFELMKF